MQKMCRLTDCSVYDGIQFQGKVGKLTLSNEKILFQFKEDLSAAPRTWLWKSMKRFQVVFSPDTPDGRQLLKICNHQNKGVSFLVPESDLLSLQKDIESRMTAKGDVTSSQTAATSPLVAAKEPSISEGKAKKMVARVESIKEARQKNRRQTEMLPSGMTDDASPEGSSTKENKMKKSKSFDTGKDTIKKSVSFDETVRGASNQIRGSTNKRGDAAAKAKEAEVPVVKPNKSSTKKSQAKAPTKSNGEGSSSMAEPKEEPVRRSKSPVRRSSKSPVRRSSKSPVRRTKSSPTRRESSKSPPGTKGKVTLGRAAQVIAQDLFIKPGKQAVHDYVVNPTNNLIVKPTNRKIVQPAKEKIVEPAAQKATQKIIKPTHRAASVVLQPPKIIARDMGLVRRTDSNSENADSTPNNRGTKKPFLHFLKTPQRRTFEDIDVPSSAVATSQQKPVNLMATSSA